MAATHPTQSPRQAVNREVQSLRMFQAEARVGKVPKDFSAIYEILEKESQQSRGRVIEALRCAAFDPNRGAFIEAALKLANTSRQADSIYALAQTLSPSELSRQQVEKLVPAVCATLRGKLTPEGGLHFITKFVDKDTTGIESLSQAVVDFLSNNPLALKTDFLLAFNKVQIDDGQAAALRKALATLLLSCTIPQKIAAFDLYNLDPRTLPQNEEGISQLIEGAKHYNKKLSKSAILALGKIDQDHPLIDRVNGLFEEILAKGKAFDKKAVQEARSHSQK